ncbi:MAG: hypothetical protein ACOVP8_08685, partial [Phycisphaerales bacterium]
MRLADLVQGLDMHLAGEAGLSAHLPGDVALTRICDITAVDCHHHFSITRTQRHHQGQARRGLCGECEDKSGEAQDNQSILFIRISTTSSRTAITSPRITATCFGKIIICTSI